MLVGIYSKVVNLTGSQASVVQRADKFMPVDKSLTSAGIKCIDWSKFYQLGGNFSTGKSYPLFEQPRPVERLI